MDGDIVDLGDPGLEPVLHERSDHVTLRNAYSRIHQDVDIHRGLPAVFSRTQHMDIPHATHGIDGFSDRGETLHPQPGIHQIPDRLPAKLPGNVRDHHSDDDGRNGIQVRQTHEGTDDAHQNHQGGNGVGTMMPGIGA